MMKRVIFIFVSVLSPLFISAQTQPQWRNQDLLQKNISHEQYEIIGKGDLAQCRADATEVIQKSMPLSSPCDLRQNPYAYGQCSKAEENRMQEREQAFRDITLGCMARKGWIYR